jgi:hypothetical protein
MTQDSEPFRQFAEHDIRHEFHLSTLLYKARCTCALIPAHRTPARGNVSGLCEI